MQLLPAAAVPAPQRQPLPPHLPSTCASPAPRGVPLDAIVAGLLRATNASTVEASFILCIQRELGPAAALEAVKAARPYVPSAFIGLGLAGAEVGHQPSEYVAAFAEAEAMGFHKMAHAGEG